MKQPVNWPVVLRRAKILAVCRIIMFSALHFMEIRSRMTRIYLIFL